MDKKRNSPLYVTKPFLPPLAEIIPYLEDIWSTRQLTNNARYCQEFEAALCSFLDAEHISLVGNATLGLMCTLQALGIKNEVITTPFSFIATTQSILWNGATPRFADVLQETGNIDPRNIPPLISEKTDAILAVHCYGIPCDADAIEQISKDYNLPVIYDAAHAFGVDCDCGSVLQHGDASIISFHATKVFNTFEGGAVISKTKELKLKIDNLVNFNLQQGSQNGGLGMNAKMNEFQACIGLVQLQYYNDCVERRKKIYQTYKAGLVTCPHIDLIDVEMASKPNYSYLPIVIKESSAKSRDEIFELFEEKNIILRKYFSTALNKLDFSSDIISNKQQDACPHSDELMKSILCLPIFPELETKDVSDIIKLLLLSTD